MSTFFHPITLIGPDAEESVDALVDTEHLFALLPYSVLSRLNVWPHRSHRYNGGELGFGQVRAVLDGHAGWISYIVGLDDETPIIGRHTLDSFIVDVDTDAQCLVPKELREARHV